ncbi:hypothetical protein GE061_015981 [Apolygus lucorum]|uniref:Major facilitator superfamily (MFS) profile domain-containing protein n=1 Tax=Apolygus lucorum TaxID=248454 RepID=A0A8S9XIX5_APOLU|nr:hypothetical protein GE061_015981 [Apolygus lucorum]
MGQKLMNLMKKEKPEPEPEIDPLTEQELEALARRTRRLGAYRQLFSSIVISFTFLVMGSSVGWTSPVLYNMRETGQPMNLSTSDATVMVSVYYLGNAVMPIPSGILSDVKGRKSSLSCLLIFPFVSWVLIYFAKRPVVLHVARLLAGMWTGIVITVGPMYLAELAQPQYRGALSTLLMILANLGALLAMVIGMRVSYWTMAVVFGLTPVISFVTLIFVPESPYWLVFTGQRDKAASNLAWLRGHQEVEGVKDEMEDLIVAMESKSQQGRFNNMLSIFTNSGNREAFFIVEAISIFQRLSGVSAIIAYVSITLPDVNIGALSFRNSQWILTIIWTLSVLITPFIIDRMGRVPLLLISSVGCALSNFALSVWFYFHQSISYYVVPWFPFFMISVYGVFVNIGINPIATTLQGEMFPAELKGIASGITAIVVAFVSFLTCFCYLIIRDHIGMYFNYLYFGIACTFCAVFSYTNVLETKGKTLLQIQNELQRRNLNYH